MSKSKIFNSWSTPIEKLMAWRGSWVKYETKELNSILRVHCDQLLITSNEKILESFNLHSKLKGIYKDDVLILILNNAPNEVRKIKFQIKMNAAQVMQAVKSLGQHFPVVKHNSTHISKTLNSKYRNVDQVLKFALERKDSAVSSNLQSDLNNFIKLCLLDPTFPHLVLETEKILYSQMNNNE